MPSKRTVLYMALAAFSLACSDATPPVESTIVPRDGGARRTTSAESAAIANIPTSATLAQIRAKATGIAMASGDRMATITSSLAFFGTTGMNQFTYNLSGNANTSGSYGPDIHTNYTWHQCTGSIEALTVCPWSDGFSTVMELTLLSGGPNCGVSLSVQGLHKAWFSLPVIGVSNGVVSVGTSPTDFGATAVESDGGDAKNNGTCASINVATTSLTPANFIRATATCAVAANGWASDNTGVLAVNQSSSNFADLSTIHEGTATLTAACDNGQHAYKVFTVKSPDAPCDSSTGECDSDTGGGGLPCRPYEWFHKEFGVWFDFGEVCLPDGHGGSYARSGVTRLDYATSAIQQRFLPPTLPSGMPACTSDLPTICSLLITGSASPVDPRDGCFDAGHIEVGGGLATAYPLAVTYRYNGTVVQQSTASDLYHLPYPPRVCLSGLNAGDIVVASVTVRDASGVTLTSAVPINVAYDPDYSGNALRKRRLRDAIRQGDKSALEEFKSILSAERNGRQVSHP